MMRSFNIVLAAACAASLALAAGVGRAADAAADPINPAPTAADWSAIAALPDWSGIWTPDIGDQERQETANVPPWKPAAAKQIARMQSDTEAGRPFLVFANCFPEGMPSWMLIMHNAFEFLFTPGRVTMLGEVDGNRMRRIYTDGRPHPEDPDPTWHGHSIGVWHGGTLVVDTIGVLPQSFLAISESVGLPNNGDLHIVEHLHLEGPDELHDDLEIAAPKILTRPWKTTRIYFRHRERKYDLVEGVCVQGGFMEARDSRGNATFKPIRFRNGMPVPPDEK